MSYSNFAHGFWQLANSPAPPQTDAATYYSPLATSYSFATSAVDVNYYSQMEANAKYIVTRGHAQEILDPINAWLGTNYQVPA